MSITPGDIRDAMVKTLRDKGESDEYIVHYLELYDANIANVNIWNEAAALKGKLDRLGVSNNDGVHLRADDDGKPMFIFSLDGLKELMAG